MTTLKTASTAKKGESYERTKVEIQTLNTNGKWTIFSRHDSLEDAKKFYAEHVERTNDLKWLIDTGEMPRHRFVEAKSICTIL